MVHKAPCIVVLAQERAIVAQGRRSLRCDTIRHCLCISRTKHRECVALWLLHEIVSTKQIKVVVGAEQHMRRLFMYRLRSSRMHSTLQRRRSEERVCFVHAQYQWVCKPVCRHNASGDMLNRVSQILVHARVTSVRGSVHAYVRTDANDSHERRFPPQARPGFFV